MKKKTLGRITALSIAALTAVPTFSIVASAATMTFPELYELTYIEGGYLKTEYYETKTAADAAATGKYYNNQAVSPKKVTNIAAVFSGKKFDYDNSNGKITISASGAHTYGGSSVGSSTGTGIFNTSYHYASDYVYYSPTTQKYYPNLAALRVDVGSVNATYTIGPTSTYSAVNHYFDYQTGLYVSEPSATTINITGIGANYTNQYVIPSGYQYASNTSYYSYETATWYPNLAALQAAVGYNTTNYTTKTPTTAYSSTNHYFNPVTGNYVSSTSGNVYAIYVNAGNATTGTYTVYYSPYTGRYYDTLSAANAATPAGYTVRTITNSAYSASYLNTYGYGYGYYNGYYDPYYYYYYGLGDYGFTGTTTTNNDTSTVTIGKYTGWTNVIKVINAARSGASYAVNMKSESEIPENVLKAMKGKNVNILFTFSNGAVITINGNDITSTTAFSPNVVYGSTSIPSSLKKKAVKANSGVSSSQFTINGGSFGAEVSVTVKFNSKRAGCSAKLYRYNASANTLSLVSRSAVQSNGQCKFDDVKQGGEYIVVLS